MQKTGRYRKKGNNAAFSGFIVLPQTPLQHPLTIVRFPCKGALETNRLSNSSIIDSPLVTIKKVILNTNENRVAMFSVSGCPSATNMTDQYRSRQSCWSKKILIKEQNTYSFCMRLYTAKQHLSFPSFNDKALKKLYQQ